MKALPQIELSRIRDHAGAKDRGFEEFAYLLAWDLENLDRGTEIERRATPDGGIEFSCIPVGKGNGGRWAWQAKYLFRFDASTFAQMTKSVEAALKNTPDLERYIFVLPKDRSTAALAKWRNAVARWSEAAKAKGMAVKFDFRGESQILAAATSEKHAGAIRYFFDETFLTTQFMANQVQREVSNLGERYLPEVNVETEARTIIDAACRGPRFVAAMKDVLGGPANARPFVDPQGASEQVILDGASEIDGHLHEWSKVVVANLDQIAEPGDAVFLSIEHHATKLRQAITVVQATVEDRLTELSELSRTSGQRQRPAPPSTHPTQKSPAQKDEDRRERERENLRSFNVSLWRLRSTVDEVLRHLSSADIAAARSGSVLLVGEAGCGKSHLVADVATERIAGDLPSFLLLGQHLDTGVVDPQLVQMMGLGTLTLGDTLQALEVAARIRRSGRALVVVDAVNEGAGADLWESQLPGFVAEVARYPWVALVVTLRDVYESSVLPGGTPAGMTKSAHRGLAGHEEEALNLYAGMYELRLPDMPALLPEITNPLFLRSLCQSVRGRGLKEIPREAGSLVWVFAGLIEAVERTLQRPERLDYADWDKKVHRAVAELAGAMVDTGSEVLPTAEASDVCKAVHSHTGNSKSLLNGLIVEGLLLRETVDHDGTATDSIRFTYQRLSDHLRAEVILKRNPTNTKLAAALRNISKTPRHWAMSGVVSALVLLVPETRGKELATVLRLGDNIVGNSWAYQDPAAWLRGVTQEAFLESLMWRDPATFTSATLDLVNRYMDAGVVEEHQWLRIVSGLACVPNHPLDAEWLHPILWRMSLPERDEAWSRPLLWVYSDDANPVSRTIDWAWANPDAPEDVARLASVYLAWLFTSPNRHLRDTATKALVSVTERCPHVLTELVQRFAAVNDPYVIDRVVAAAYGHLLRRRHHVNSATDLEALKGLAQAVYDAVFGAGEPVAHLMLRHRARMCAQIVDDLCQVAGGDFERDLAATRPPYGTPWPLTAPTAAKLAKGFGRTYSGYLGSATELDWEFEQHLERHVLHDLVLPDQEKTRTARRRNLSRQRTNTLRRLVTGTAPSRKERVRRRAESLMARPQGTTPARFMASWNAFETSLPKASRSDAHELRKIVEQLAQLDSRVFHPEADLCIRWMASRMLELGWTKDRFGESDSRVRSYRGQNATEPIAKKYERIAFQELCGHLADHCTIDRRWKEDPEPYQGPWQISQTTDIDPSLLVRGDDPEGDTSAGRLRAIRRREESQPAWWRTVADHRLSPDGTNDAWLSATSDIPRPEALVKATDPGGGEWLALERHQGWEIKDPSDLDRNYRRNQRQLWIRTQANLIRADDEIHPRWTGNTNWMGLSKVSTSPDMSIGDLGEYPDLGAWPSELDLSDRERRPYNPDHDPGLDKLPTGWELAWIDDSMTVPYALATVGCHWEQNDYSATDTPSVLMPSRVLLKLLNAHWAGGLDAGGSLELGPIEREYSWISGGDIVAFCSSARGYGGTQVLWVRADPLRQALADAGLGMWTWVLGEKIYWTGNEPSNDRTDCFAGVRLAPGPTTVWGFTVERTHGRRHGDEGTRSRILAERADGIEKIPMARELRPNAPAGTPRNDLDEDLPIELRQLLDTYNAQPTSGSEDTDPRSDDT